MRLFSDQLNYIRINKLSISKANFWERKIVQKVKGSLKIKYIHREMSCDVIFCNVLFCQAALLMYQV